MIGLQFYFYISIAFLINLSFSSLIQYTRHLKYDLTYSFSLPNISKQSLPLYFRYCRSTKISLLPIPIESKSLRIRCQLWMRQRVMHFFYTATIRRRWLITINLFGWLRASSIFLPFPNLLENGIIENFLSLVFLFFQQRQKNFKSQSQPSFYFYSSASLLLMYQLESSLRELMHFQAPKNPFIKFIFSQVGEGWISLKTMRG